MEISNLFIAEFKTLVTRMLKELSEDLSSIKRIQLETKDLLTKIKNNLQGINSRVDEAEKQINDLEHKKERNNSIQQECMKPRMKLMIWRVRKKKTTNQNNKKKKESKKNEASISSLWDNFKRSNIRIIWVARRRERARNGKPI